MKKRLLAVGSLLTFLTACGGTTGSACKEQYWDGTVGMCLTAGWTVLDQETRERRGAPGEVVAAFQKEQSVAGQFPTIVVTKETVPEGTDSTAFSKASIRSVTQLPGYKLIDTRPLTVDGKDVEVHVFSAKPQADEPERRFYQVSVVKDGIGYTFSGIAPLSVGSAVQNDLTVMLNSVTLTAPGGEEKANE